MNTVARRPKKILQNNTKPVVKIDWPGKLAAVRPPILDKSGRKEYLMVSMIF
jgi:hypothetical protein